MFAHINQCCVCQYNSMHSCHLPHGINLIVGWKRGGCTIFWLKNICFRQPAYSMVAFIHAVMIMFYFGVLISFFCFWIKPFDSALGKENLIHFKKDGLSFIVLPSYEELSFLTDSGQWPPQSSNYQSGNYYLWINLAFLWITLRNFLWNSPIKTFCLHFKLAIFRHI